MRLTACLLKCAPTLRPGAEMAVRDNFIYIAAPRPVTVKVFTILGQLISQTTLPAGIHRLPMSAKGIYIIKIGGSTRRVTI